MLGPLLTCTTTGKAFEVEFTTRDGRTAGAATVEASDLRPVSSREITHARELIIG